MPTIRIDQDVWQALQQHATPFVDTPNDVLRRLLKLKDREASLQQGGNKTMLTPEHEYRVPIAESLRELGGSAGSDEVLKKVFKRVESLLRPADREVRKSGEPRWRLQARFERKNMQMDGLLKNDSPHGWWELTEKGFAVCHPQN